MKELGEGEVKKRDEALKLVNVAFMQAQRKMGTNATSMSLGVLKNRLLQITDRRFDPKEFGASDMRSFVAMLEPHVVLSHETPHGEVQLVASRARESVSKPIPARRLTNTNSVTDRAPDEALKRNGRIREDLWVAIMDYTSGQTYVWDERFGVARVSSGVEDFPMMPTLTAIELGEWRRTFLSEHRNDIQDSDLASALRWEELGLATSYLPAQLQQPWNRELALRVRQRLQEFFSGLNSKASSIAGTPAASLEPEQARDELAESLAAAKDRGDGFMVGELLAQQLYAASDDKNENLIARIVSAWASPRGLTLEPASLLDLSERFDSFSRNNLATAFINAMHRVGATDPQLGDAERDFAFRLKDDIAAVYDVEKRSPTELCRAALAKLEDLLAQGAAAVTRFLRTTPATAKVASTDLLRAAHKLQPVLVAAEREFLCDLDVLIGPAFRKLCEAYERNEDSEVIRRAPEYLENIKIHRPTSPDPRLGSQIWLSLVQPVLDHLTIIVEDATSRGEAALAPSLSLRNPKTKADLRATGANIYLSFSLWNQGKGHARDVSLQQVLGDDEATLDLNVSEPAGPFDIPPGGEQLVRLRLVLPQGKNQLCIPIQWRCVTSTGKPVVAADRLLVDQQVMDPDWEAMLADPPYTLNPIKRQDRLYGRNSALQKLHLAAMAGTSTFVWGQKRIGKTSLLQVLAAKLSAREDTTCVLLRMGELASLHEGQLAHRIAQRLVDKSLAKIEVPQLAEFGAGINLLVPFVERLSAAMPEHKFIVIIDEFDDLDSAFYTGERGRQFIKGLRSASEVGLTFFFVGSERMDAIYGRHQADLNKWTNVRLDRIDNRADCQALITKPVEGDIEFDVAAVDFVIEYTAGNPFYIHNFCFQLFERCVQEHRTFIDPNDTFAVRQQLLRSLGPTNFSHLWEDNPVLDLDEKRKESAENCIALSCVSALGGRFEGFEELMEAQEALPLAVEDRATATELRRACARLLMRDVLMRRKEGDGQTISLQIFREWLGENARSKLLPLWCSYKESERKVQADEPASQTSVEMPDSTFAISEDDMLAVAQRLIYCGKQKDVAEIKSWLRQFDDDSRIETAFLLLQRVAERGFINEGMRGLGMNKIEEMILAKRRTVGNGSWNIVKNRRDNLAIGYVDAEHKSGATMARDAKNMLRVGKCAPAADLEGWMRSHAEADALVIILDDFAGTGSTLVKGMRKFQSKISIDLWERYIKEGRLALFVMFAFPEALDALRDEFPGIQVLAATVLSDELRACDDESGIFESEGERNFARDVLQQIGRELSPSYPLGHGDMGALVVFHNTTPNNTLPIFWSGGSVQERPWKPLFPRS